MLRVVGRMLGYRRGPAFALALLSALCVAAAVAMPLFTAAADHTVTASTVRGAATNELLVSTVNAYHAEGDPTFPMPVDAPFTKAVDDVFAAAHLTPVAAAVTNVYLTGPTGYNAYPRLLFRENFCAHVVIEAGRCPVGAGEVAVTADYAANLGLKVGATVPMIYAFNSPKDGWKPDDSLPMTASIVGVYHAVDPAGAYWGTTSYFDFDSTRYADKPVLTTISTMLSLPMDTGQRFIDGVLDPSTLTPPDADLDRVRAEVTGAVAGALKQHIVAGTKIPDLIDRIQREQAAVHAVVPLFAAPLVALGWFVIFLATGYAVSARRGELGVIAMRGTSRSRRWTLAAGEAFAAVLAGIPAGIALGAGVTRSGEVFRSTPMWYAGIAALGALAAVALAARRHLRTSTVDLLRDSARPEPAWRAAAFDAVMVALAAVAMFQLLSQGGVPRGVQLVAPALAVTAIGLVSARVVAPLAAYAGARLLRGGRRRRGPRRMGLAIGALQLARRPGAVRLYTILAVTVGISAFTVADGAVAGAATVDQARVDLGATRVLASLPTSRYALLKGVREADPTGAWAMAAISVPTQLATDLPIIAVDSTRLDAVAQWPAGPVSAPAARRLLDPSTDPALNFIANRAALDIAVPPDLFAATITPYIPPAVVYIVVEADDGLAHTVEDAMVGGRHTYAYDLPWCSLNCRLVGVGIRQDQQAFNLHPLKFTAYSLRVVRPSRDLVTDFRSAFHVPQFLRTDNVAHIGPYAGGLPVDVSGNTGTLTGFIAPTDAAYPIPALATGPLTHVFQGRIGGVPVPLKAAGTVTELPRLGVHGIMIDMGVLDSASPSVGDDADTPEVWLGPHAPADAVLRLNQAGLQFVDDRSYQRVLAALRGQGPAVARHVQGYVLPALVLLGLMGALVSASVDRRRRAGDLRALRVQGLGRRAVSTAALTGYAGVTLAAIAVGLVAGLAVWHFSRAHLPIFTGGPGLAALPAWPPASPVALDAGGLAALLIVLIGAAVWDLRRAVSRAGVTRGARLRNRASGVPD